LAELCDEVLGSIGAAGAPGAKLEAARTRGSTTSAIGLSHAQGQKLTWRLQFVMSPLPRNQDIACAVMGSTILGVRSCKTMKIIGALYPGAKFPCSSSEFPCYALGISLFRFAGNFALAH
jgi:hypothetical protein